MTTRHELENGLSLIVEEMPSASSTVVLAGFGVGSRDEAPGQFGMAHFLEHMLFKGTRRRPRAGMFSDLVDTRGGNHNAHTNVEETAYFVHLPYFDAAVAVDAVSDIVTSPLLDPAEMRRERGVIRDEISKYANDPNWSVWDLVQRESFPGTGLEHPIQGTQESVAFGPSALRSFFQEKYVGANATVALVGHAPSHLVELASKKFGKMRSGESRVRSAISFDHLDSLSKFPFGFRYAVGNTDKYHAVLRFQGLPLGSDREYDYDTMTSILGGTSSSRLWMEMREKRGLTYGVNASHLCLSDRGSVLISFALEPKNLAKATSVLAAEIRKMRDDGPTAKEIAKSKSHKRGSLALQASDPMNVAYNIVLSETMIRSHRSFEQQMEKYAAVRRADVAKAAANCLSQDPLFCVIGPKGGEKAAKAAFEASFG